MTAFNITENPEGTDKKVLEHRKREKNGRYVRVDERTMIFVKNGQSVEKVIKNYKSRIKNRPDRWG